MKRLIAVVTFAMCVFLVPTLAAASGAHKSTAHMSGTITHWQDATKEAIVKDSEGRETLFGWNETTTFTGTPQVGDHATVSYTKDKDGNRWLTHVGIELKPTSTKPKSAKPHSAS